MNHFLCTISTYAMKTTYSGAISNSYTMVCPPVNRGSYTSAHVLLNLLNELGKSDKMRGLPSILSLFATSEMATRVFYFISYDLYMFEMGFYCLQRGHQFFIKKCTVFTASDVTSSNESVKCSWTRLFV